MADKTTLVPVEIFGQTYTVRAGADPGYVEKLAERVDAAMQEVSRSSGAVDSMRVAVLTALNFADECQQLLDRLRQLEVRAGSLAEVLEVVGEH
jgi:cell division protein ZapA